MTKTDLQGLQNPDKLIAHIRQELEHNKGDLRRLSRLSGLNYHWIRAVMLGKIEHPQMQMVMRLLPFLGIRVAFKAGDHFNRPATQPATA